MIRDELIEIFKINLFFLMKKHIGNEFPFFMTTDFTYASFQNLPNLVLHSYTMSRPNSRSRLSFIWKGINCVNSILHLITNDSMNLSEVIIPQLVMKNLILPPHGRIDRMVLLTSVCLLFGGFGVSILFYGPLFCRRSLGKNFQEFFSGADVLPPPPWEKRFWITSRVLTQIISS